MTHAILGRAAPNGPGELIANFAPSMAVVDGLMQVQRLQLEALNTWQQSMAEINQELWDEWVCHWGGGAPIDA